jgi:hypothetical protein
MSYNKKEITMNMLIDVLKDLSSIDRDNDRLFSAVGQITEQYRHTVKIRIQQLTY